MTSKVLQTILGDEVEAPKPTHHYTQNAWEGKNYDHNLDLKEIAKRLKIQLKKEYPKCKFSVQIQRYSMGQSLHISLMEAPFKAIICDRVREWDGRQAIYVKKPNENNHAQISQYNFGSDYETEKGVISGTLLTKQAWECIKRASELASNFNFDDSDGMIDYFHTNFYLHLNIGKWDKPFKKI